MPLESFDFIAILRALASTQVRYVLIGGVAMSLQGAAHITTDLDVVYARDDSNLAAMVMAFAAHKPCLRGVPDDLPFLWDARTLKNGMNFTLRTALGDVDMLGDAAGVDSFQGLWQRATLMDVEGMEIRVASVDDLIAMKEAANRLKDQPHLVALRALRKLPHT